METKKRIAWNKGIKTKDYISEEGKKKLAELRKQKVERICIICKEKFLAGGSAKYCKDYGWKRGCKYYPPRVKVNSGLNYKEWQEARVQAINRDSGGTCSVCEKYVGSSIDVHHIDENGFTNSTTPNHSLENLICLCHKCHLFISSCLWYKKNRNWQLVKKLII